MLLHLEQYDIQWPSSKIHGRIIIFQLHFYYRYYAVCTDSAIFTPTVIATTGFKNG